MHDVTVRITIHFSTLQYTFLSFCTAISQHEQGLTQGEGQVLIYGMEGSCDLLIKQL